LKIKEEDIHVMDINSVQDLPIDDLQVKEVNILSENNIND
jgi:hypothetical protein